MLVTIPYSQQESFMDLRGITRLWKWIHEDSQMIIKTLEMVSQRFMRLWKWIREDSEGDKQPYSMNNHLIFSM